MPRNEVEERLVSSLEAAGISSLRYRTIDSLSGGQKQKVAIAAILALRPEVLLLYEPTSELDPKSSVQIFQILKELNERHGITIIVVEQKIMLLSEFVKNLAVMRKGSMILYGSVRDVLRNSDTLEQAGINCPRVVTLSARLEEMGIGRREVCINIDEAESMVRRLIHD